MTSIRAIYSTLSDFIVHVQAVRIVHPALNDDEVIQHIAHNQGKPAEVIEVHVRAAIELLKRLEVSRSELTKQ